MYGVSALVSNLNFLQSLASGQKTSKTHFTETIYTLTNIVLQPHLLSKMKTNLTNVLVFSKLKHYAYWCSLSTKADKKPNWIELEKVLFVFDNFIPLQDYWQRAMRAALYVCPNVSTLFFQRNSCTIGQRFTWLKILSFSMKFA